MDNKLYNLAYKILRDKISEFNEKTFIVKHNIINNFFNVIIFLLYVIFLILFLIVLLIVHLLVSGSLEIFNAISKIPTEKLHEKFNCKYNLNDCNSLINHICDTNKYEYLSYKVQNILFNLPNIEFFEISYLYKEKKYENFNVSKEDLQLMLNKYNKNDNIDDFFNNEESKSFNINYFFVHGFMSNCLTYVNTIENLIHYLESYDYSNKDKINGVEYANISINLKIFSCNVPGLYGKNEVNIDDMDRHEILSFYNYLFRQFIIDNSNKNDINNLFGFSASAFTFSYLYTIFPKELIDKVIDYDKYINNFNEFKNITINNLYLLNSPGITGNAGLNGILNGIVFKYIIPYSRKFYDTKLGQYLSKYYNFIFIKDLENLNEQMFYQYFFCQKFNYYEPFNLVSKFIDFDYLYSHWNITSLQNIENILNNTHLTTCYARQDTFINLENGKSLEKYVDNNFINLKNKYYNFIFNGGHRPPHSNEFSNLIITDMFRDIVFKNNFVENKFNKYEKNLEPHLYSFYNPLMQLINMKEYEDFISKNKIQVE